MTGDAGPLYDIASELKKIRELLERTEKSIGTVLAINAFKKVSKK